MRWVPLPVKTSEIPGDLIFRLGLGSVLFSLGWLIVGISTRNAIAQDSVPPVSALSVLTSPAHAPALLPSENRMSHGIVPVAGTTPLKTSRVKYYLFQVQVIEVDDQGVQTVVATPRIQTTGAPAGFVSEQPNGQRFEFSVSVADPLAQAPLVPGGELANPVALVPGAVVPGRAATPLVNTSESAVTMPQIGGSQGGDAHFSAPNTTVLAQGNPVVPLNAMPDLPPPPAAPGKVGDSSPSGTPTRITPDAGARSLTTESKVVAQTGETVTDRLSRKISVNISNEPRRTALRKVAQVAGINIIIDPVVLTSSNMVLDGPVSLNIANQPADEVLEQLVSDVELTYAIKHEVVLIGHAEQLQPKPEDFYVKTYAVGDLAPLKNGEPDFAQLIDSIQKHVQPKSWQGANGGSIRVFQSTGALVVRQTEAGHFAVEKYLKKKARPQ